MIGAVVLAGGQGKRMGAGINKQYLKIGGRSVLSYAIESMAALADAGVAAHLITTSAAKTRWPRVRSQRAGCPWAAASWLMVARSVRIRCGRRSA